MSSPQTPQVQTEARGDIPDGAVDLAVQRVRSSLRLAPEPVLFARVKLTMAADPAVERPAIAQANIDLNGRLIRAQAVEETMREAIERMHDRLTIRLERAARNWAAIRGGEPVARPHEWRHQSLRTPRMPYFPRSPEERTVIRHKSYALARETPDEAVADLELLDYDFHLFTEKATGEDSASAGPRADTGWPRPTRSPTGSARWTPRSRSARIPRPGSLPLMRRHGWKLSARLSCSSSTAKPAAAT